MSALARIVAGIGLVVVGTAFLRLARSDRTHRIYLVAIEYGFAAALVVAGIGLIVITGLLGML